MEPTKLFQLCNAQERVADLNRVRSRNVKGRSRAIVVSQSDNFAISAATGFLSTP